MENLEEFCPDTMKWRDYIAQLESYFEENGIEDEHEKKSCLFAYGGMKLFNLVIPLLKPANIEDVGYDNINPKETIQDYVRELKNLSRHCNFKDPDDRVRDRLLCGMHDKVLREKFLADKCLTLQKILDKVPAKIGAAIYTASSARVSGKTQSRFGECGQEVEISTAVLRHQGSMNAAKLPEAPASLQTARWKMQQDYARDAEVYQEKMLLKEKKKREEWLQRQCNLSTAGYRLGGGGDKTQSTPKYA